MLLNFETNELKGKANAKLNFTDVDAPFMKGKKGEKAPHFNVQIMVETHQFIAHAHVTKQANDSNELKPCLEGYKKNTGNYPDKSNFDSGYMSFANLEYLEQNEIQVLIPHKDKKNEDKPFHISKFKYIEELDYYICPV